MLCALANLILGRGVHSELSQTIRITIWVLIKILTLVGLIISIVAVFFAELAAYSGLLLVIFGLTSGFVSPIADLTGRMAYTVAAVAIPVVANSLDVIPGIGMHLNAIIDNIAIMVAGMVIANFLLAVKDSILPSSS